MQILEVIKGGAPSGPGRARAHLWVLALPPASALVLSGVDPSSPPFSGFLAYLVVCSIAGGIGWWVWRSVAGENPPRWLFPAVLVAVGLRLAVGVGLARALPIHGYDEDPQRAGYVFYDSFARDEDAWARARSTQPLLSAFTDRQPTDQYGGLLFLSMLIYRVLSPDAHRELLIVVLGASVSALGVVFGWRFADLRFGERPARFAAWILVLYPEAVLLASSQMREPFLGTGMAMALWGWALARSGQTRRGFGAIALAGALMLALSPPAALVTVAIVGVGWVWEGGLRVPRRGLVLSGALVLSILGVLLLWQAWSTVGDLTGSPLSILRGWWENVAGEWRLRQLQLDSDWVTFVFQRTPAWTHVPLALVFGLIHPFLPAALADNDNALWQAISIWRSVGWYLLLPFLLYAPWPAFRVAGGRSLPAFLSTLVWTTAIVAAFRASSYQWDSPRYRAVFLVVQAALAGWSWYHAKSVRSPWLARLAAAVGIATLLALQWYLGRDSGRPLLDLPQTVAAIALVGLVLVGGGWAWDRLRGPRNPGLTKGRPDV